MPSLKWFHPSISGPNAEKLLNEYDTDGCFLVRHSSSTQGDFTLSVRHNRVVMHIKIQNSGDYYDLYGGEKFATLSDLVDFYVSDKGQLKEKNGGEIMLKFPCMTADPTPERWFHGHMSGAEAEKCLMDNGKNFCYLVRDSLSSPGNFVLSVRLEDKVTHIQICNKEGKFDVGGGEKFTILSDLVEYYKKSPMVEMSGIVVHLKHPFNTTRITASGIDDRIKQLQQENVASTKDGELGVSRSGGFWDEFKQLQLQEERHLYSRKEGERPENRCKNRYKNILPFDHTRVVLHGGDPTVIGSDYINANFVSSDEQVHGTERSYIATQGCLQSTIVDFWRMIWQEKCQIIVSTTKEAEKGKIKMARYWPEETDDNGTLVFNSGSAVFSIELMATKTKLDSTYRKFLLSRRLSDGSEQPRKVYQFHFLVWPDYGAPAKAESMLTFLDTVGKKRTALSSAAPVVVHCSAGIGRTGTFITLDILFSQISRYGLDCDIDIQKTILALRSQRSGMVQTEAQYKFIYATIHGYIAREKSARLSSCDQVR